MNSKKLSRGRPISLTDDALLDVARSVFLAKGIEATTSEIAKRARISESVIFHRYKTKEAFFTAVLERELAVPEGVRQLASRAGTGAIADNLFDAGLSLVEMSRRVLPFVMIAAAQPARFMAVQRQVGASRMRVEVRAALVRYFAAEIQKGRLRAVSPDILVQAFLGGITEFVLTANFELAPPAADTPTYLRSVIDLLLRGALAEARP